MVSRVKSTEKLDSKVQNPTLEVVLSVPTLLWELTNERMCQGAKGDIVKHCTYL